MAIEPLGDRVLVKSLEAGEEKKGGIIIPDTAKEKPQEGKVLAVGKGKSLKDGKKVALGVKKGERILFAKYSGTEVQYEGKEYLIMGEDDILAIIK